MQLFSNKASLWGIVTLQVVDACDHPPNHPAGKDSERRPPKGTFCSLKPTGSPGTTEESFCVSVLALMASEAFLSVSHVTSPFRAATTECNRFTHSVDRSLEGSRISWAYWCPKRRSVLYDALVSVDVNPTALNLDRLLRQQLTDGAHELTAGVNLKELRPPQGAPLVNRGKAIGDLCRSLPSQGLASL